MPGLDQYDISVIRDESKYLRNELENIKEVLKESNSLLEKIFIELVKLNIR